MLNPSFISYQNFGAQIILTFSGEVEEVAETVNTFANYGMFTDAAIPSEYEPEKHSRVTIAATKTRVLPALTAICEARMVATGQAKAFKGDPAAFHARAVEQAQAIREQFQFKNLRVLADELKQRGNQATYEAVAPDQDSAYFRKAGKRILGEVGALSRELAAASNAD